MPRQPIDIHWQERVRFFTANEPKLGPKAVEKKLEAEAKRFLPPRTDWPSERTIGRYHKEFLARPEAERRLYRVFSWPWAMEVGELPWEAAPVVLELMRYMHQDGRGRPLLRLARWFWRVSLAAPDAPIEERLAPAKLLAMLEVVGSLDQKEAVSTEWLLAYAPWRSEQNRMEYDKATMKFILKSIRGESGDTWPQELIPPFYGPLSFNRRDSPEKMREAFTILLGVSPPDDFDVLKWYDENTGFKWYKEWYEGQPGNQPEEKEHDND